MRYVFIYVCVCMYVCMYVFKTDIQSYRTPISNIPSRTRFLGTIASRLWFLDVSAFFIIYYVVSLFYDALYRSSSYSWSTANGALSKHK